MRGSKLYVTRVCPDEKSQRAAAGVLCPMDRTKNGKRAGQILGVLAGLGFAGRHLGRMRTQSLFKLSIMKLERVRVEGGYGDKPTTSRLTLRLNAME